MEKGLFHNPDEIAEKYVAGILAKSNKVWADAATTLGVTPEMLNELNWRTLFTNNLITVTIGNVAGGTIFVGIIFWLSFLYKKQINA